MNVTSIIITEIQTLADVIDRCHINQLQSIKSIDIASQSDSENTIFDLAQFN